MARHPGRAMACQTLSAQPPPTSKAALYYWRGTFGSWQRPAAAWQQWDGVHNRRGSPIQQTECACPCCVPFLHTVGRQRDPLRQVSQPHPRWGICIRKHFLITSCSHRRCLIVFTVFRGAANDPGGGRARRAFLTLLKGRRAQPSLMCRSRRIARLAPSCPIRVLSHCSPEPGTSLLPSFPSASPGIPTFHCLVLLSFPFASL